MTPAEKQQFPDIPGLLEVEQLWLTGQYEEIVSVRASSPESLPAGFPSSFTFSAQEIQQLYRITDEQGRLLLHESFINYLQRFECKIEVTGMNDNNQPLYLRGPLIQLKLLKIIYKNIYI